MLDGETDLEQETAPAAPRQAARRRAPKSPEAARRGVVARRMDRRLAALKASKDVAKLEQAEQLLAKLNGDAEPEASAVPAPPSAPPEATPPEAAPPSDDVGAPSMPAAEKLAEFEPLVAGLVSLCGALLQGTRFAIDGELKVKVGDQVVSRHKQEILTAGLTPLAAKYLPSAMNTPEALAAMAIATVFSAPLMELAAAKLAAARSSPAPGVTA